MQIASASADQRLVVVGMRVGSIQNTDQEQFIISACYLISTLQAELMKHMAM